LAIKIIKGLRKGYYLKTVPKHTCNVRPMLARVKKSLFDVIKIVIKGADFVDLFAGLGTVGLEALSCNAKHVTFVESNYELIAYIKHNINILNFQTQSNIIKCNLLNNFKILQNKKFDIIFLDPPYNNNFTYITLRNILKYNIIKANSLIVSKRHIKEAVDNLHDLVCIKMLKYGDTVISFYKVINLK
jgi:16S rRNA (guanine(966)-N(2))-methyltransferase RsmD